MATQPFQKNRKPFDSCLRLGSLIVAATLVSWSVMASTKTAVEPRTTLEPALAAIISAQEPAASETSEEGTAAESPAKAFDEDPAAQKRGLELFRALCTGYCHSTSAKVQKDASYLFDCQADHGLSDTDIHKVISDGIPDTRMQGFGGKLPEDDIWKLVSFMRQRRECEGS